jgi:DNA repair protein RecN (Recombination protein N)
VLLELRLRNLALAADVRLALEPGLNVLTGSAGAGKSLVVEALHWLRGQSIDRGLIRAAASEASAEAIFDLQGRDDLQQRLRDLGIEPSSDGSLRLRREIRTGGRSRAYVDAELSSASVLCTIAGELIELQSQHQQLALLDVAGHVRLLDDAGVSEDLRRAYRRALDHWRSLREEVEQWRQRRDRIREQRELLEFQLHELEQAHLRGDEMEGLRARVSLLAGGARLLERVDGAVGALQDERSGAWPPLQRALAELRSIPEELAELVEAREELRGAAELVRDALGRLESFLSGRDFDPDELDRSQERLATLEGLSRKYGRTESELLGLRDRLRDELGELELGRELPQSLRSRMDGASVELQDWATKLHRERKRVARGMERAAAALLRELGMEGAAVRFEFEPRVDPEGEIRIGGTRVRCANGGPERVRLHVRTNPGEPFGPVERMASGGELSRIGLVLRALSLRHRRPALIILDEVDAGLGADLGPALATRLAGMSSTAQLLVISHLPAVAARADRHLVAQKSPHGDRTESRIETLGAEQRVEELSRMLGGPSARARELARQMLETASGLRAEASGS